MNDTAKPFLICRGDHDVWIGWRLVKLTLMGACRAETGASPGHVQPGTWSSASNASGPRRWQRVSRTSGKLGRLRNLQTSLPPGFKTVVTDCLVGEGCDTTSVSSFFLPPARPS